MSLVAMVECAELVTLDIDEAQDIAGIANWNDHFGTRGAEGRQVASIGGDIIDDNRSR